MIPLLRRLARPLSVLTLAALLTPAVPAECRPLDAPDQHGMPCCARNADAGSTFDGDCCALTQQPSLPHRAPASAPAARQDAAAGLAASQFSGSLSTALTLVAQPLTGFFDGPPTERLFLRLSVIRR